MTDIEDFYDLLGHNQQTEIRALQLNKNFKPVPEETQTFFVSSKEEFIQKVQDLNGKFNLYAGLNERSENGTTAKEVISVKRIFIDIDCKHKPSSQEDIAEAEKVTNEIISTIEQQTGLRATKIFSGNGYQLIYCIPEIKITEENREQVQEKIQTFLRQLIKKYSNEKVQLDNVGDLPRIIRITGTVNIKGNKTSEFVEVHKEKNEKLKDYILNLKPETNSLSNIKVGEIETSFRELLEKNIKVKNIFEGNCIIEKPKGNDFFPIDKTLDKSELQTFASRSEAEESLVFHFVGLGLNKEQIFSLMTNCKIGKWQTANIQYRDRTYHNAVSKVTNEKQDKTQYKKIRLSELSASLINKYVEVDCQITGEQIQKAIPENILVKCATCGEGRLFNSLDNPELFIADRDIKTILTELKNKFMCQCVYAEVEEGEDKPKPYKTIQINSYTDFSILYVRDLLDRESLTSVKRYEAKKVYVINQTLPNAKTINIKGKVFIEPKTKNLSIICDSIQHLENQVEDFKITETFKENSKKYFNSGDNVYKQINPDIVGKAREIAKQSLILQLHSPCKIYDITRKKLIRGGLNIIFYGDTKCGKSEIAKDITQKGSMPLGEYTICETGGRTGFLYTIDRDKGSLIWGSLALNDMGLVILDGLQSMHSEELGEFREAIEQQEIIVRRSITGDALARTRILGSLNPNKPMVNYIYKCQALQDTYVFSKAPEFTRWDLFIPFSQRDVSGKEIAHRTTEEKPIPEDVFMQHIYWAWSRKPEHIIYTESAVKKINDFSEQFIEVYSLETLPIVHNGIRDIITRISVAVACQTHSTDETQEKIIVETEHVQKAVDWYRQVLDMLELARYKQDTEGKSELTDNDCIAIAKELGETEWQILEEIKHEQKTSTQLSATLDKSADTIKEHYKLLKKHNLIETKTGQGVSLSIRGVRFVRWGMLSAGGLGDKTTPNKNDGGKKTHQPTCQTNSIEKYVIGKKQEEIDFSELDKEFEDE